MAEGVIIASKTRFIIRMDQVMVKGGDGHDADFVQ